MAIHWWPPTQVLRGGTHEWNAQINIQRTINSPQKLDAPSAENCRDSRAGPHSFRETPDCHVFDELYSKTRILLVRLHRQSRRTLYSKISPRVYVSVSEKMKIFAIKHHWSNENENSHKNKGNWMEYLNPATNHHSDDLLDLVSLPQ